VHRTVQPKRVAMHPDVACIAHLKFLDALLIFLAAAIESAVHLHLFVDDSKSPRQCVPYLVVCVIAVFIYTLQTLSGLSLPGKSKVLNFLGQSGPFISSAQVRNNICSFFP